MRITNKIMQRNNLSNINTNKIYQDKLSNQMSTQKKINRPSDDPVVAIRALRLRSSVTEITQYYSKNIPDANSWLDVTEGALKNLADIVTNMISQCTKGANGDLTSTDRQIILEQLKALSDEVYSTGDVDYAGRYVFTGYRTDTSLSYQKSEKERYEITEQLDNSAITQMTHVNTGNLLDWNTTNFKTYQYTGAAASGSVAGILADIDLTTKLSDLDLDGTGDLASGARDGNFTIRVNDNTVTVNVDADTTVGDVLDQMKAAGLDVSFDDTQKKFVISTVDSEITADGGTGGLGGDVLTALGLNGLDGTVVDAANLPEAAKTGTDEEAVTSAEVYRFRLAYDDCCKDALPSISFKQKTATGYTDVTWVGGIDITMMHDYEDPYTYVAGDKDAIVYVPETGEILLGENRYGTLMATKDDPATAEKNEGEIRLTYQKENWLKGDLRPEHYFYCRKNPGGADELKYNSSYLTGKPERQEIEYDVGFNQTIRVNSTADECFQHGIGREADDLVAALEQVVNLEAVQKKIEESLEEAPAADKKFLQNQLDAVKKALELSKDKCQKLFERGITTFQGYLDDANLCITNCGTRSSKLDLIEHRMQSQKTTFETLKSENEDIDITETAIQLKAAELTYEAALMATGKVMQTTLLNFI